MKAETFSIRACSVRHRVACSALLGAALIVSLARQSYAQDAPLPATTEAPSNTVAPAPSTATEPGTAAPASEPSTAQSLPSAEEVADPAPVEPAAPESGPNSIVVVAGPVEHRERLPVRAERRLALVGEVGWNTLAGFGPNIGFHAHPHFTIEMGGGLSLEGWKLGLRGRYNWLKAPVTPFLGIGAMVTTGLGQTLDITDDATGRTLNVRVLPSSYLQFVGGIDWTSRGGFTLIGALGYARLLRDRNYEIVAGEPNADERRALKIAFESGIVISLAIGYTFK